MLSFYHVVTGRENAFDTGCSMHRRNHSGLVCANKLGISHFLKNIDITQNIFVAVLWWIDSGLTLHLYLFDCNHYQGLR